MGGRFVCVGWVGRSGTPSAYMTDDRSEKPEPSFKPSDFNSGSQQQAGSAASSPF